TVTVVLSGQRLSGLSQVAFDAPGLASTPFAGGSSGQASVQVQVAADAPLGVTGATVLVDAGEVLLPQALTVTLPQPAITSINPSTVLAGVGLSTVTVKGRNFAANAEVLFNSAAVPTTWVSSTELTAVLPSQTAAGVLQTQVRIPGAGGAPELLSNASPLRVDLPVPPVLNIEPSPIAVPPDARPREVTLRLSKADFRDHTITFSVSDPAKLTITPTSLVIPAGETTARITVTPGTLSGTVTVT